MDAEAQIAKAVIEQSEACERGIFAIGEDPITGQPIAALALIAPNCVLFTKPLIPERDIFIDICLN